MIFAGLTKHIKNSFLLSRPLNIFISFISVWLAALLSVNFHLNINLYFAGIIAALITAGANIVNDIYDIEIDRINKPDRLLPLGIVSLKEAWLYFIFSYFTAFIIAVYTGSSMFSIALCIAVLLYFYALKLKRTVLWGNLIVAFAGAMAFIYGAMAVNDWRAGIIPAGFAFFFHLGREILKDIQDLRGDLSSKAVTFPGKYGKIPAILLINFIFALLVILTILPYIFDVYNTFYFYFVLISVDLILIYVALALWKKNDVAALHKFSVILKYDMFMGLISLYVGTHDVILFN